MIKISFEVENLQSAMNNIGSVLFSTANLQTIAEELGNWYKTIFEEATPVDTGLASDSWVDPVVSEMEGGMEITVDNAVPYINALLHGSDPGSRPWPRVGPKTVEYEGKIYSNQTPGGIVAEAMRSVGTSEFTDKFVEAMIQALKGE